MKYYATQPFSIESQPYATGDELDSDTIEVGVIQSLTHRGWISTQTPAAAPVTTSRKKSRQETEATAVDASATPASESEAASQTAAD